MSSTTFGSVFRVGASSHSDETLDTWSAGTGGAAVVERLMRPLGVVEPEIAVNSVAGVPWMTIVGQIDLLIFQAAPQALGKDVIQCPPLAIHTDLDARRFERLGNLWTGEMTALIRIPNLRDGKRPRLPDRREHKTHLQGLVKPPTDHIAAEPVDNRHQVQPAVTQADVRDIAAPNVIRVVRRNRA